MLFLVTGWRSRSGTRDVVSKNTLHHAQIWTDFVFFVVSVFRWVTTREIRAFTSGCGHSETILRCLEQVTVRAQGSLANHPRVMLINPLVLG